MGILLLIPLFALAKSEGYLFKDFKYGSSQEIVKKSINVRSCGVSREGYDLLCKDNYSFFNEKWEIVFCFEKDKLVIVALSKRMNQNTFLTIMGSLPPEFVLVAVQGNNGLFDFVSTIKTNNESKSADMLAKFGQEALREGYALCSFFDTKSIKPLLGEVENLTDLIRKAPDGLREIDVEIADNNITMRFCLPMVAIHGTVKEKF